MILADYLKLPSYKASKAVLSINKRQKKKVKNLDVFILELDYLLYEPMKEIITMTTLLIRNIPLMYFLNKSWYETLMFTIIGKVILAICILVIFISLAVVIKLTKPV